MGGYWGGGLGNTTPDSPVTDMDSSNNGRGGLVVACGGPQTDTKLTNNWGSRFQQHKLTTHAF